MAANRTTRVSLVAEVSGYISGMDRAARATRETGSEAERLSQRRDGIQALGTAMFAVGTLAAAGVGLAVAKYAEFDAQMSSVQAATHETSENMGLLRDAAIEAGASTVFSATEAAQAVEELAKAGVTTADILGGGLKGALDLASAGQLDVAQAAEIAATAMTQFGLAGTEVPHIADLLAAGAGKAQGSVEDLSNALNQGGLVASQTGLTIEETTGALAAFASAGLTGSDAGTSFKSMLQRLTPQSAEAQRAMDELGISAYDSQGQFIGLEKFAGNLQTALKDLTPEARNAALGVIFGSDAVRGASVIYEQGAAGIGEWIDKVNDTGYAAETARLKLDNLKGDLEKLGGAFDTALIQTGSSANGVLRNLVQTVTFLVDSFGSAPPQLLAANLGLLVVVASVGLVGGGILLALPKIVEFRAALALVGVAGRTAAIGIGVFSAGLAAVTIGVGYLISKQAEVAATTAELADTLDSATGATTDYTRAAVARKLSDEGVFDAAKKAGVGQKELTDAVLEGGKALDDVYDKIDATNTFGNLFDGTSISAANAITSLDDLRASVEAAPEKFKDLEEAGGDVEEGLDGVGEGLDTVATKADEAGEEMDALKAQIEGLGQAQLDVRGATRELEAAIDAVSASVAENGATLDVTTAKGRENEAALDAMAQASIGLASSTFAQTGSQEQASAAIATGRQRLIEALAQFGITGAAAEAYADQLGLIPSNIKTTAQMATEAAAAELAAFRAREAAKPVRIVAMVDASGARSTLGGLTQANGGVVDYFANGGMSENHVAQIAPAGAWRVWAEPETGGEAYIPLAESKRARSMAVWEETGRRIGAFADGGMFGAGFAGASGLMTGDSSVAPSFTVSVQSKGGVDLLKYVDVAIHQDHQRRGVTFAKGRQKGK
jgi:TP901 family phage tail tape measure protein